MFLTAYNLPHYLMSKGVVSPQSLVQGDFVLAEVGRRNRNFKILRAKSPGLFVKQVKTTDAQAASTLQREAAFYRLLDSNPQYAGLKALVPNFVNYDSRRHTLTLELVAGAESLAERNLREGVANEHTARGLGSALGFIHAQGPQLLADATTRTLFTCQLPWPMILDQAGFTFLETAAPIGPQLAAAIRQQPGLQPMLSSLRAWWQYDSLIHGDMKWDNCLIGPRASGESALTIVDWELLDLGDGAWDVAGIFKEYIVSALVNESQRRMAISQKMLEPAAQTLAGMQPSIRAFWEAYVSARASTLTDPQRFLDRSVRFVAARMLIAVLEYGFSSPQLGEFGGALLQSCINILQAPEVARAQLLGQAGA